MTSTEVTYWCMVFICSFVVMGGIYMVYAVFSEGWRIIGGVLKRTFGPTTIVFLVMSLIGVMVLIHYLGLVNEKGDTVGIKQKIEENTAAFFKLIEKEPVVRRRTKNDWDDRPEASYFRYQEYLKKEEKVKEKHEERLKGLNYKARQIEELRHELRNYDRYFEGILKLIDDSNPIFGKKNATPFLDIAEEIIETMMKRISSFKLKEQGEKK